MAVASDLIKSLDSAKWN